MVCGVTVLSEGGGHCAASDQTAHRIMREACPLFCPAVPFLHLSVLHGRGLLFSIFALGYCLFSNSLRDILTVTQVLSAWAQGVLINVSPSLTRLCAVLHTVMSKDTLQRFFLPFNPHLALLRSWEMQVQEVRKSQA